MIKKKLAMHGLYKANNIRIWHIRSHFLSPNMLVAHVNGRCVETCINIKLPFFLHVPISLRKISFNIMGHGMDLIMKVLLPCLWTLPIYTFMTMNLMMKRLMKITHKTMGYWYMQVYEIGWYLPNVEKKKYHNQPSSSSTSTKKTLVQMGDIM